LGLAVLTLALTARADTSSRRSASVPPQQFYRNPANANDFALDFFHHESKPRHKTIRCGAIANQRATEN